MYVYSEMPPEMKVHGKFNDYIHDITAMAREHEDAFVEMITKK